MSDKKKLTERLALLEEARALREALAIEAQLADLQRRSEQSDIDLLKPQAE